SMLPDMRDLRQVQRKFLLRLQNAEALGKCLHHSILDPIMDHFDEMPRAMRTDMTPAFVCCRCQRLEDGAHLFHDFSLSADHQAISFCQAPDPAACARVDEVYPFGFKH